MRIFWLLIALVVGTTACGVVSQPDQSAWRDSAVHSLEDASAALATTRVVVTEQRRGNLPVRYAVTLLSGKEEGLAKAESSLATLQPPDADRQRSSDLLTLLGEAVDAQREVRVLVVDRDPVPETLLREIDTLITELDRAAGELE
ncbi:hypothetical protein ACLM5J_03885 [Nocardioides sp. Bht2]|uniref:hypothetical protein n=1 Tax=Nocardioides sp. Bht2 TaxID=3392297 RepID=UPI0039B50114